MSADCVGEPGGCPVGKNRSNKFDFVVPPKIDRLEIVQSSRRSGGSAGQADRRQAERPAIRDGAPPVILALPISGSQHVSYWRRPARLARTEEPARIDLLADHERLEVREPRP